MAYNVLWTSELRAQMKTNALQFLRDQNYDIQYAFGDEGKLDM